MERGVGVDGTVECFTRACVCVCFCCPRAGCHMFFFVARAYLYAGNVFPQSRINFRIDTKCMRVIRA